MMCTTDNTLNHRLRHTRCYVTLGGFLPGNVSGFNRPLGCPTREQVIRRPMAVGKGPARAACAQWLRYTRRSLALAMGLGLATIAQAEPLKSLHVWIASGTAEVHADTRIPDGVTLEVFDVAGVDHGEQIINDYVMSRIDHRLSGEDLIRAYKALASEFLTTPGFDAMKNNIELGAHAIQGAIYFQIERLPAVVINEKYTLYNVVSLAEAIAIFNDKVPSL